MTNAAPLKFTIVSTSQRTGSNSRRVAEHSKALLLAGNPHASADLFDLAEDPLPLFAPGNKAGQTAFEPLKASLSACDGLVLVTPEWSGMASPAAKNFMLYASNQLVGHKAGLLVSVSSGMGGTYPIAELRMSSYKNNRICWTPDHVIVRGCGEALTDMDEHGANSPHPAAKRLRYCIGLFDQYAQALRIVRASGVVDHEQFGNGL